VDEDPYFAREHSSRFLSPDPGAPDRRLCRRLADEQCKAATAQELFIKAQHDSDRVDDAIVPARTREGRLRDNQQTRLAAAGIGQATVGRHAGEYYALR